MILLSVIYTPVPSLHARYWHRTTGCIVICQFSPWHNVVPLVWWRGLISWKVGDQEMLILYLLPHEFIISFTASQHSCSSAVFWEHLRLIFSHISSPALPDSHWLCAFLPVQLNGLGVMGYCSHLLLFSLCGKYPITSRPNLEWVPQHKWGIFQAVSPSLCSNDIQ